MAEGNLANNSDWKAISTGEDIVCKDCIYRDDGTIYSNPYTKGSCQKFPCPRMTPLEVMPNGESRPQYKKED